MKGCCALLYLPLPIPLQHSSQQFVQGQSLWISWSFELKNPYLTTQTGNKETEIPDVAFYWVLCIRALGMKMTKSEFKFIITLKEAAYEGNWNYFSKIKTQQDIETSRGGSKQRSQDLFCWLEKNSCHWMDCTSLQRKAFPVCFSFSTWNPAEV